MNQDRRKRGRHQAAGPARVRWWGFDGNQCVTQARVQNVSAGGMAMVLREPLPVGELVRVRLDEAEYPARVRRCRKAPGGFLAGLEIVTNDTEARWRWLFCRRFEAADSTGTAG